MTVYERITQVILELLSEGIVAWQRPWKSSDGSWPCSGASGKRYNGVNIWILSAESLKKDYKSKYWLTLRQIKKYKGKLKKDERGTTIVQPLIFTTKNKKGEKATKLGGFTYVEVYNLDQTEDCKMPKRMKEESGDSGSSFEDVTALAVAHNVAQSFLTEGPSFSHGGSRAYYQNNSDKVRLPHPSSFNAAEEYYSTLFHELTHSTGHFSRIGRFKGDAANAMFGSESYSKEELVAEMGAAFLCGICGIECTLQNSAAYINGWRSKLNKDPKLIIQAASAAERAAKWIIGENRKKPGKPGRPKGSKNKKHRLESVEPITI